MSMIKYIMYGNVYLQGGMNSMWTFQTLSQKKKNKQKLINQLTHENI